MTPAFIHLFSWVGEYTGRGKRRQRRRGDWLNKAHTDMQGGGRGAANISLNFSEKGGSSECQHQVGIFGWMAGYMYV